MHVRIRFFGKPDTIVVVQSKLTTIEEFRQIIYQKFNIQPKSQKLFYGGKLLENGYTFHDYSIKLNDVIQLMVKTEFDGGSKDTAEIKKDEIVDTASEENLKYIDAASSLYEVGDLVDMRDQEQQGAWYEGKITRIVHDPKTSSLGGTNHEATSKRKSNNLDSEDDVENKPPHQSTSTTRDSSTPKRGINHYFSKSLKSEKSKPSVPVQDFNSLLLYQVKLDTEEDDDTGTYCKLKDIRPRARIELDSINLKVGQIVMINYNIDEPLQKGYWYDFKISEIKKTRYDYYLIGTLYLGPDAIPQNDTKIRVHDKIFKIEEVVPLAKRTEEYKKLMITPPEKRAEPIACQTCNDDESSQCKDCGCTLCSGKNSPDKILLCDECNKGYHMMCLDPPLTELPKEDWYCPSCRRDPNDVIAPGASKQVKKTSKSKRDWGRGMACVGKTKTCLMPPNHFGPIPGIEVGMCWRFRIQLSETGVHRPPVSGIHGRDVEGAYSIVLSGGYEDDVDNGNEFTYTGSGGRDLSGNKRTAEQSCDQTLTRENKALARNCAVKSISEEGGDAGDNWRSGKPVRVVRSYKMIKHFPKYAPKEGIRYDGIYKVVKYYPEKGLSGYRVWKYLLRRDDPNPAPWEPEGKEYPIVYPDGYLEAEAEKKAQKINNRKSDHNKKKRALRETNQTTESDIEEAEAVPVKKQKMSIGRTEETNVKAVKLAKNHSKPTEKASPKDTSSGLSDEDKAAIKADTLNSKLWKDCLSVCETKSKKEFVEYITQEFCCIICQEVVVSPVTTPCRHNFCLGCIKNAFKVSGKHCPHCRANLADYCYEPNEELKTALRIILPGYDAGKR